MTSPEMIARRPDLAVRALRGLSEVAALALNGERGARPVGLRETLGVIQRACSAAAVCLYRVRAERERSSCVESVGVGALGAPGRDDLAERAAALGRESASRVICHEVGGECYLWLERELEGVPFDALDAELAVFLSGCLCGAFGGSPRREGRRSVGTRERAQAERGVDEPSSAETVTAFSIAPDGRSVGPMADEQRGARSEERSATRAFDAPPSWRRREEGALWEATSLRQADAPRSADATPKQGSRRHVPIVFERLFDGQGGPGFLEE